MPVKPREFMLIPLRGGDYQLSFLRDETPKWGSVTVTPSTCVIVFFKETAVMKPPQGAVAYDVKERSLVSSDGEICDLSNVARLSQQYSKITAAISKATHKDNRTKRRLFSKYGVRKRNRVEQALNVISKMVVKRAKEM